MRFFRKKPELAPPSGLLEPDLSSLVPIFDKHSDAFNYFQDSQPSDFWVLLKVKDSIATVIFHNFKSISLFMDEVYYARSSETKEDLAEHVEKSSRYAISSSWAIGREWALRDNGLVKLADKKEIETSDVPADALAMLMKAAYFPYWVFAVVLDDYYRSKYGRQVRSQRDAHFKDIYQGFLYGLLMCFHIGVKSVKNK